MQHKWLKRRCEAAAAKAGGSSPRVLARVLACCGRFLELLHPEGAERMERLRQAEAAAESAPKSKADAMDSDAGIGAMRAAIAATEAVATVPPASTRLALAQPIPGFGDAGRKQVAQGRAMGSAATTEASPGAGEEVWPKVGQSRVPSRASSHGRPPSRLGFD